MLMHKWTWSGRGFKFCNQISRKHHNGLDKTKNIACEHDTVKPTKSKRTTPPLLGPGEPGVPTKSRSLKSAHYA